MYIIVSSGKRAARIASKFADSIIIDRDSNSAKRLEERGFTVLNEDASNPEVLSKFGRDDVVILADEDHFNVKVAKVAGIFGLKTFAMVEDEEKCSFYENAGVSKICNSLENLISKIFGKNRYFEIQVGDGLEGKTLKEYDAGEDCMVVSIFRDSKAYQPFPDMVMRKGDVLGVVCGEQVRTTKNPFDSVLLLKAEMRDVEIDEAEMLANRFSADLIVFEKVGNAYACSLKGYAEELKLEDAIEMLRQAEELDLIVTSLKEKNEEVLKNLVSKFPTLIAAGKQDYGKILALMNSSRPDTIINMAKAFSRFFGSTKLLFLEEEQLKHFSKFTETEMEVAVSRGNPMVDAVREFKSGYDLVILSLSNDVGNIDRDILWKIILNRKTSVLVVE